MDIIIVGKIQVTYLGHITVMEIFKTQTAQFITFNQRYRK